MVQTVHGQIGHTSKDKPDSKGSKINTDLIEYVPKTLVKKKVIKTPKHVDTVFKSIQTLPMPTTKVNINNTQQSKITS